MGCGGSKLDDLPLVKLSKERKDLIKAASDHRYALAAAHISYFRSLKDVGDALRKFVDEELVTGTVDSSPPDSPVLTLPSEEGKPKKRRNTNIEETKGSSSSTSISHSLEDKAEDSHLHLSSESDSDLDSSSGHVHIHDTPPEPEVPYYSNQTSYPGPWNPPGVDTNSNYNSYPAWNHPGADNFNINSYPSPWNPYAANISNFNSYPSPNPPGVNNPNHNSYTAPWNPPGVNNSYAYYMKKSSTRPNVVYEDPRAYSANLQWQNPSGSYSNYSQYGNEGYFGGYQMEIPQQNSDYNHNLNPPVAAPPPAPPSPGVSNWDFFNIFNTYNDASTDYYPRSRYAYGSTTSSPDSKEVREREGIPDLEDETEPELIKVTPKGKRVRNLNKNKGEGTSRARPSQYRDGTPIKVPSHHSEETSIPVPLKNDEFTSKSVPVQDDEVSATHSSQGENVKSSPVTIVSMSSEEEYPKKKAVSFEVDEESIRDIDSSKLSSLTTLSIHQGTRDLQDAVKEIRDEFQTASSYGKEISIMLEVGKVPYQSKGTALKVIFSKVLYSIAPTTMSFENPPPGQTLRLASNTRKMAKSFYGETGKDINVKPLILSSTLEKLYMWEKKLYKEVKDEERLRVIYEKQCKKLQKLDSKGAESSKIEETQATIKKLQAQLNVNIRAIDAISRRIQNLRDEELQPQLSEFIQGLTRMWKSVLKCHQRQLQVIVESKTRTLRANTVLRGDSRLRATIELEMELLNWCTHFDTWIKSQKLYVECLNGWLVRCILQEPEETVDGIAPFSPSKIGAPPVFIICNDWFQAMERISESSVEKAMNDFALSLHLLWEKQGFEQNQKLKSEFLLKDYKKNLKAYGMEKSMLKKKKDEKIAPSDKGVSPLDDLKVDLDSMRKKLEEERVRHKEAVKLSHNAASSSIQGGLTPIFEALGNFTSEASKLHEQIRTNGK